jgi:hypothetical protein
MKEVPALKSSINRLTLQLKGAMAKEGKAIVDAYDATPDLDNGLRDLRRFTGELLHRVKDPGVLKAVADVRTSLKRTMIHERDDLGASASGLSIFMPSRATMANAFKVANYSATRFAADSGWDEFLKSLPVASQAQ